MKETQQAEAVVSRLTRPDQSRPEQHSKEWASCAIMEKREGKEEVGGGRGVCIYMPWNFYFYFGRQKRNVPPKVKIKQKC